MKCGGKELRPLEEKVTRGGQIGGQLLEMNKEGR